MTGESVELVGMSVGAMVAFVGAVVASAGAAVVGEAVSGSPMSWSDGPSRRILCGSRHRMRRRYWGGGWAGDGEGVSDSIECNSIDGVVTGIASHHR